MEEGKMVFEYQYEEGSAKVRFELRADCCLDEVLEEFGKFLRACGYIFELKESVIIAEVLEDKMKEETNEDIVI